MADILISRNKSPVRMQQKVSHPKKSSKKTKTPRRPVTPGKTKAKSGRDLWMNAIKKRQALNISSAYRSGSPRHKTPTEFWVDTLRKTGIGLSTETTNSQSLTGLKRCNEKHYPYMSTPHYMRQFMGTEKAMRGEDPTARPSPGTPSYKSPEEYYEEVMTLRKHIAALNHESGTNKTKIRRLEEDNQKKEKEIEVLLNPGKNGELRRTLGDRQVDSGAVVHSLKQKILKLEMQLRDKESAFGKLQADLKTTKLEEMRVQTEALYAEVLRLQMAKESGVQRVKSGGENTAKVKALSETVIRLSRTNEQLQVENKALKDDLHKALEDSDAKLDFKKDHGDMNRKELLLTIGNLEKRLEKAESRMDGDTMSLLSQDSSRRPQGKIELQGSLEDRLHQLDVRETELIDELERLKNSLRKHRDDKRKEDASLPPTPRRRQSKMTDDQGSNRLQSGRRSSRMDESSRPSSTRSRDGHVENFRQKHAATSIQRQWRQRRQNQHIDDEKNLAASKIQDAWKKKRSSRQVEDFRQNHAARKIQHGWLDYKHRHYDEDLNNAAFTIQGALKGHHTRREYMKSWNPSDYDSSPSETDDGVYLIQSSLRGHHVRKQQLRNWGNQYPDDDEDSVLSSSHGRRSSSQNRPSYDHRPSSSGLRPSSGSRPGSGSRPSSGQRPLSGHRPSISSISKRGSSSHSFKARYDVSGTSQLEADDDDDIMF